MELKYWLNVLKKIMILIIAIIATLLSFKVAIFYMPFIIAFIISLLMEPVIKFIMKRFKFSRKTSSIIVFILSFGVIFGLASWGIITLISESNELLSSLNDYYMKSSNFIQKILNMLNNENIKIPKNITEIFRTSSNNILEKISLYIQEILTKFLSGITAIPKITICFAITILALYFICTDRIYILDELEYHLPEKWAKTLTSHIKEITISLGGYLKAQLILILISFVICLIGLYILSFCGMEVGFPLIIAIGIAFVDALPILGSGTVMVPWAIASGLNGELNLGISIIFLWIIMSVVRQFIEPKIVSGKIGIHPIFTIIAMYTGFKFIGVIGMFIGPIVLIILKNVFSKFLEGGVIKGIFEIN